MDAVGYFTVLSTGAQSGGCNLTIEVLYRVLHYLQDHNFKFAAKATFYGDNHTDNKTPTVLVFIAHLVKQCVFKSASLGFQPVGHGHNKVDNKNANMSKELTLDTTQAYSPARFFAALRSAFAQETAKPTIILLESVGDWSGLLADDMRALDIGRLCCSQGSGDFSRKYEFTLNAAGEVIFTYHRFLHEQAKYPRSLNEGQNYTSALYGVGQVVSTCFEPATTTWATTIMFPCGASETISLPVAGIVMFPRPGPDPPFKPRGEPMSDEWAKKLKQIKKNIDHCAEKLTVFQEYGGVLPDVYSSWSEFFAKEEILVAACSADPTGPYYRGPCLYTPSLLPTEFELAVPVVAVPAQLTPFPPYPFDPVTHPNFTGPQRAAVMESSRHPPSLQPGGLVLLKLRFGANTPATHSLPFCLAFLPADFSLLNVPDGALIKFKPFFSATEISGTWSQRNPNVDLVAPLSSIMVSDLEFTQQRKLKVISLKKIRAFVPPYELGEV